MKLSLITACALTGLSGVALAQTSTTPSQSTQNAPAATNTPSNQTGTMSQPSTKSGGTMNQAQDSGVRRVEPAAAVKVTYYRVNPADMRASKLIGTDVYNRNNENIGEINDLIIDNGKTVKAVVVSVGGFLGIGDRNVAVDPASVLLSEQMDGTARIVVNTTKDELKSAPAFNFAEVDKAGSTTGTASSTAPKK